MAISVRLDHIGVKVGTAPSIDGLAFAKAHLVAGRKSFWRWLTWQTSQNGQMD